MIRTALAFIFLLLAVPLGALIAVPWTLLAGNVNFLYALGMRIARAAVRLAGVRVVIRGVENLDPAQTYFFMSNHVSNIDPPIVIPAIPRRTSVLVKKEVFRIPVLAQVMRLGSLVPVDRKDRESAIASLAKAAEVLKHGISMTAFPEGTRSPDARLLPFKKGAFYLAMDAGVPVVPVTIAGTHQIMPKGSRRIRAGTATVIFHPPIDPKCCEREELMERVRAAIASALAES